MPESVTHPRPTYRNKDHFLFFCLLFSSYLSHIFKPYNVSWLVEWVVESPCFIQSLNHCTIATESDWDYCWNQPDSLCSRLRTWRKVLSTVFEPGWTTKAVDLCKSCEESFLSVHHCLPGREGEGLPRQWREKPEILKHSCISLLTRCQKPQGFLLFCFAFYGNYNGSSVCLSHDMARNIEVSTLHSSVITFPPVLYPSVHWYLNNW